MTASLRGLTVLVAIMLALAIGTLVGREPPARADDHAVMAPLDPTRVQTITWQPQPLALERIGQGWKLVDDPTTPVVARAVDDLLSSLRAARWHRRADRTRLGAVRRTLVFAQFSSQHTIELGAPLAGTDQSWIAVDHGDALLVDNWLVALLDPSALGFRDRTPLAAAASASAITVHGAHELELAGPPWRVRGIVVAPALVEALVHALSELVLIAVAPAQPAPITTIAVDHLPSVGLGGACPEGGIGVAVGATTPACTDAASAAAVIHAIEALAGAPAEVIDRRPLAVPFDELVLPDGTLTIGKRPTIAIAGAVHRAELDRIAELVHALAEPGEPIAPPTAKPDFTLVTKTITLDVFATAVQRRGEPLALAITPATRAVLGRSARVLIDAERWSEEPTTITTLALDGITYTRGVVLGEWSRTPAGPIDPALVDALAQAVAKLHAPARTGNAPLLHHLTVTFAPPVGPTVVHTLALGSPTFAEPGLPRRGSAAEGQRGVIDGCAGESDEQSVTAPLALCTAVAALAR